MWPESQPRTGRPSSEHGRIQRRVLATDAETLALPCAPRVLACALLAERVWRVRLRLLPRATQPLPRRQPARPLLRGEEGEGSE